MIESGYGKLTVLVSNGQLPWPWGRDMTGYAVPDLAATLAKATAAGVETLVSRAKWAGAWPRWCASPAAISPKSTRTRCVDIMKADPRFVDAVLDWPPTWFVARLLLVGAYLVGALAKLGDWPGAVAEQAHFGMHPPAFWAAVTIAVELIGPALILVGRLVWLGAGMLGVFTVLACLANPFWAMQGRRALLPPMPFSSISAWRAASCLPRWWPNTRGARGACERAGPPAGPCHCPAATAAFAQSADQVADQADALPRSVIEAWRPPTLTITRYTENWSRWPIRRCASGGGPGRSSMSRWIARSLPVHRPRAARAGGGERRADRAILAGHGPCRPASGPRSPVRAGLANAAGGWSAAPLRSIAPASIWCRPLPT
jgi:uncharacterized membrane protein YphA (DoxX/SURF4 family)